MLKMQVDKYTWDKLCKMVGQLRASGYKDLRINANALIVEWSGVLPEVVSVQPPKKKKFKDRFPLGGEVAKFYHELYTYYCIKAAKGYDHDVIRQNKSPLLRMLMSVAGAFGANYEGGDLMSRTLLIDTVLAKAKITRAEVEQEFSILGPPPIEEDDEDDEEDEEDDD